MLELDITTANNNGIIVNALELVRVIEELGIHTEKGSNPFWYILNFKCINYIEYERGGIDYISPVFKFVKDNYISYRPQSGTIDTFFGINFGKISNSPNAIYRIIGYWTDNDRY